MKQYTLTLIFHKDLREVLMCWHEKQQAYNFIGGSVEPGENSFEASYRELFEETGISANDAVLVMVRDETVRGNRYVYQDDRHMYVTCAVVDKSVHTVEEKNHLEWMDIGDTRIDKQTTGFGNCRVFLNEALMILQELRNIGVV